jgi:hypothetical protein
MELIFFIGGVGSPLKLLIAFETLGRVDIYRNVLVS